MASSSANIAAAFGAFCFEITTNLSATGTNLLAVRVSNAAGAGHRAVERRFFRLRRVVSSGAFDRNGGGKFHTHGPRFARRRLAANERHGEPRRCWTWRRKFPTAPGKSGRLTLVASVSRRRRKRRSPTAGNKSSLAPERDLAVLVARDRAASAFVERAPGPLSLQGGRRVALRRQRGGFGRAAAGLAILFG